MAEIQLTDEYGFLGGVGGSCCLCGASKRTLDRPERIVTTNLVTDMEDAPPGVWPEKYMEFCEQCINEMGRLVGMVSENEYQALAQDMEQVELMVAGQAEELAMLRKEVEQFGLFQKYIKQAEVAPIKGK